MTVNTGAYYYMPAKDIDLIMADSNVFRIYRSTTGRNGTFAFLADVPLVAGQTGYVYTDTSAQPNYWYQHSEYNTVTLTESQRTEPQPAAGAPVIDFATLVRRTADLLTRFGRPPRERAFPGPSGTTTGAGSASSVVCAEYSSSALPLNAYQYHTMLFNDGPAAGQERQVASLAGGAFTMADAFSIAPHGTGSTFDLYSGLTSSEWADEVNDGFLDVWYPAEVALGGISGMTEYPLPYYLDDPAAQSLGLVQRYGSVNRKWNYVGGEDYVVRPGGGGAQIYLPIPFGTNTVHGLRAYRNPPRMFDRTDTVVMGEHLQQITVLSAAIRAAWRLSIPVNGVAEDKSAVTALVKRLELRRADLVRNDPMWQQSRSARQTQMVGISDIRW